MKCPNCDAENLDGVKYCPNCGSKVESTEKKTRKGKFLDEFESVKKDVAEIKAMLTNKKQDDDEDFW